MKKLLIFVVLSLLLTVSAVAAVTHTVPGDYSTIQMAVDAASAGDTIFVKAGTHDGATIDKAVEIYGESGTVIDGKGTIVSGKGIGFYIQSDDVTIRDLTIMGTGINKIDTGVQLESTHSGVSIQNVYFDSLDFYGVYGHDQTNLYVGYSTFDTTGSIDDGGAVRIKNVDNSLFEWNTAYNGSRGFRLDDNSGNPSDGNTVSHNTVHDMDQYALGIYHGGSNNLVKFNTFYNLLDRGMQIGYGGSNTNNVITHNKVYNTNIDGIVLTNCVSGCVVQYNTVYNTAFDKNTGSPSWTQPLHGGIAIWSSNVDVDVQHNIVHDNGDGVAGNDGNCGIWIDSSSIGSYIADNSVWNHANGDYCDNDDSSFGEPGDVPEFTFIGAILALVGAGVIALGRRK